MTRPLVIMLALVVGCYDVPPPTSDAGTGGKAEINDCCNWWYAPFLFDDPKTCLCRHTEEGQRRVLLCLAKSVRYVCDKTE